MILPGTSLSGRRTDQFGVGRPPGEIGALRDRFAGRQSACMKSQSGKSSASSRGELSQTAFPQAATGASQKPARRSVRYKAKRGTPLEAKIMSDTSRDGWAQVEVWSFRRYDFRSSQYITSIGKAEISAIERFGAEAIAGSMECVPQHRLDGNGIYTPPAVVMSPAMRRRLERLRAQYSSLLANEDHGRLEGWSDRVDSLSEIVRQIDEKLALGTSSLVQE